VDRPYRVLKNQLEKMDWEYQTGVFSVKREKEMVKRMDDLERQLAKSEILYDKGKEVHAIQKELRELYAEANVYHQLVLNHASESEKHHQEAIKCFKRIDELSSDIDKIDEKIVKTKMEADNVHAEFLINKRELLGAEKKKWKKEKGIAEIPDSELRKKAEKILEDFRNGKKITIEELSLLEKSGL
jgi:phosphoserine phosphatase